MAKIYRKDTIRCFFTDEQRELIRDTGLGCRWVYNHFLKLFKEGKEMPFYNPMQKKMVSMKKGNETISRADSIALQKTLFRLCCLYSRNSEGMEYLVPGEPELWEYTTAPTNGGIKIVDEHIFIPKLQWVRMERSPIFNERPMKMEVRTHIPLRSDSVTLFWG